MARIALILALGVAAATPAAADVAEAADVVARAYGDVAARTAALADAAARDCDAASLRQPMQDAWDAWARIDFVRLGPVEKDGRALAMAFWPDPKSSGLRAQQAALDDGAAVASVAARFAAASVAMRGFAGLERLVYDSPLTGAEAELCLLTRATAADLARMGGAIAAEWPTHAGLLNRPGGTNSTYLSRTEARQALYTQLVTGLSTLEKTRLGRPLGTFDKPRPERAEGIAAGRSLRNVVQSLDGMRDVALALYPDAPQTRAAFDRALNLAEQMDDPVFAGVAEPQSRLKVELLQQAVNAAKVAVEREIGPGLGVTTGFNAQDGD